MSALSVLQSSRRSGVLRAAAAELGELGYHDTAHFVRGVADQIQLGAISLPDCVPQAQRSVSAEQNRQSPSNIKGRSRAVCGQSEQERPSDAEVLCAR